MLTCAVGGWGGVPTVGGTGVAEAPDALLQDLVFERNEALVTQWSGPSPEKQTKSSSAVPSGPMCSVFE